jgi:hypothetical protein
LKKPERVTNRYHKDNRTIDGKLIHQVVDRRNRHPACDQEFFHHRWEEKTACIRLRTPFSHGGWPCHKPDSPKIAQSISMAGPRWPSGGFAGRRRRRFSGYPITRHAAP